MTKVMNYLFKMFPLVQQQEDYLKIKINSSYIFTEIINWTYQKEKLRKKKKIQMQL